MEPSFVAGVEQPVTYVGTGQGVPETNGGVAPDLVSSAMIGRVYALIMRTCVMALNVRPKVHQLDMLVFFGGLPTYPDMRLTPSGGSGTL